MSGKEKPQFGMVGLGVMGQNLALNIADHGYSVAVWNLETEWVDKFLAANPGKALAGAKTLENLVGALERPRRIMLLIKAGEPVDQMLLKLKPLLEKGDIVLDGGNSWFKDTQRREREYKAAGLHFFGSGVSGGEEGARYGPSLMPGGDRAAWAHVKPVFEAIAAQTESGPCVTHVGPDGSGHFVKMVHNGIEYGDMQLIAESYDLLRRLVGLQATELSDVFAEWNRGPLESFLVEITAKIFKFRDGETGQPLVDLILDEAGQKGTGKWTTQVALDLGVAVPTIQAAVDARVLSSMKKERAGAAKKIQGPAAQPFSGDKKAFIASVRDALYASKICSYAQGMGLIAAGSREYGWNIDLREMARIWKGGCIIRAKFLNNIMKAYETDPALPNLLLDPEFNGWTQKSQAPWRQVVAEAAARGIPVPAISASLAYFDSYRTENLPQNLTQAQRDFFGAHTYLRSDHPERGPLHTDWNKP